MVQVVAASTQGRPTLTLDCYFDNGETMRLSAIADTGATRSVISGRDIPPGVKLTPSSETLIAANGTSITNGGTVCFKAHTISGQSAQILAIVSPDLQGSMLVGWQDLLALNVVPASFPSVSSVSNIPPDFVDSLAKIKEDYSDVLVNSLGNCSGTIKGPEMHIELDESVDIKPCKVTTARPVPIHMKPKSDKLMKELVSASVIVPCIEPTKWTSPAHFVDKPGGEKARLVTDYRQLNKAIKRPIHPFYSAHDLMKQVRPESRWFAKLDAVHGYIQVPLDYESSLLTAFLLPSGKWRYTVAPMGLNSNSDEFNIRTDAAVEGLEWLMKIVDDMLVQAPSRDVLFVRLRMVLDRCREAGIRLSLDKLAVGQTMKFAGFVVSPDGVRPDPSKMSSIRNFPKPKNLTELRSFLGLANQLASFLPDLAHSTVALRELTKKKNAFLWLDIHDLEF